ncbi:MAG: CCA tRNA nucleotidyltransferase [Myxococcota bacterium]|nr:CCA tRNA nucleotidyltransferase [Myxococcota bacterium]
MSPANLDAVPAAVLHVLQRLQQDGHQAYLVGGCVRDMLRGMAPKDFDLATSALPQQVQRLFPKVLPTGLQHGTVTVMHQRHAVEVTTFRTEGDYLDGRRPSTVEFRTDIRDDLSRRDFTINAMALNPLAEGGLVDPFGGEKDLAEGILRCVGQAHDRFSEDGLRALRAVRFATVLHFQIHPDTLAAIPPTLPVFRKVSRERIRVELEKLLLAREAPKGLQLLRATGLLGQFLPEADSDGFDGRAAAAGRAPAILEVRLAAWLSRLSGASVRDLLRKLTFPNKVADRVGLLIGQPLPAAGASDVELRRWLSRIGLEAAAEGLQLALAQGVDQPEQVKPRIEALIASPPPVSSRDLALDGAAIMRLLGVGPSRIIGDATRFLLDQVIEEPTRNSASSLEEILLAWHARSRG